MKIPIYHRSSGKYFECLIDEEDYLMFAQFKWYIFTYRGINHYVDVSFDGPTTLMHRLIMNASKGQMVDHIDGNGLNNQRSNLRFVTIGQNRVNSKLNSNNSSGFRGVYKDGGRWRAEIVCRGKRVRLGNFAKPEEAAEAYDLKAIELFGEFARLNFTK